MYDTALLKFLFVINMILIYVGQRHIKLAIKNRIKFMVPGSNTEQGSVRMQIPILL